MRYVFLIQSMHLISCLFDINWFFFGLEEFKKTVTRNTIIKTLSLLLIFTLVNEKNDLYIYIGIMSGSILLSQLLLWPFVKKIINCNIRIKIKDIKKHFIPCLKLFLPVIAVTIYRVIDKTMLGLMINTTEVGYYENAEKIINVVISILTALGTVMLPRMSNLYAKGDNEESKNLISKSMSAIMFISLPMMLGLIAISKDFAVLFFGINFEKSGVLMIYLAVTILFLAWGNVIRTQYLIPKEMDKEYIISAFLGAGINLIFNIILIPIYGAVGACIGTVIAEFMVVLYQTIAVRKKLPIVNYLKNIVPFIIKSLLMFVIIFFVGTLSIDKILKILIQVFCGSFIYLILNYEYINSIINIKKLLNRRR